MIGRLHSMKGTILEFILDLVWNQANKTETFLTKPSLKKQTVVEFDFVSSLNFLIKKEVKVKIYSQI